MVAFQGPGFALPPKVDRKAVELGLFLEKPMENTFNSADSRCGHFFDSVFPKANRRIFQHSFSFSFSFAMDSAHPWACRDS